MMESDGVEIREVAVFGLKTEDFLAPQARALIGRRSVELLETLDVIGFFEFRPEISQPHRSFLIFTHKNGHPYHILFFKRWTRSSAINAPGPPFASQLDSRAPRVDLPSLSTSLFFFNYFDPGFLSNRSPEYIMNWLKSTYVLFYELFVVIELTLIPRQPLSGGGHAGAHLWP